LCCCCCCCCGFFFFFLLLSLFLGANLFIDHCHQHKILFWPQLTLLPV
jgi:hypothetical protein